MSDENSNGGVCVDAPIRRVAPWPDFAGNAIHEGDTIEHPNGDYGEVIFLDVGAAPADAWRVDYRQGTYSRLSLQIGDKGQAVVRV